MKKIISVVITGAGNGTRMGCHKILMKIKNKPVLWHTLNQFKQIEMIDEFVVVGKKEDFADFEKIINELNIKNAKIVEGGPERIISEINGIKESVGDYIITHDGCRPFPPVDLIKKLIEQTLTYDAAMTAINPTATVKYGENGFIENSFARANTWIAQTPQGFKREYILKALETALEKNYYVATDDSELVAKLGIKIKIVEGDDVNIKITYPKDIYIAEKILEVQENKYV